MLLRSGFYFVKVTKLLQEKKILRKPTKFLPAMVPSLKIDTMGHYSKTRGIYFLLVRF